MSKTYDEILADILERVGDSLDTRVGSLAYIMASATAINMRAMYDFVEQSRNDAYLDTATGERLESLADLYGFTRRGETNAVVKLVGGEGLNVGDKVACGDLKYEVISLGDDYMLAECTTQGIVGNSYVGEVVPVDNVNVTEEIKIVEIVAYAEGEEEDDELRKRCLERAKCPMCTGNVVFYKEILDSIAGVGGRKIVPAYEGGGSVKVIVTDTDYNEATQALMDYVKSVLDPVENEGLGMGLAPIGHRVTVETVEKVDVEIVVEAWGNYPQDYYLRYARNEIPKLFKELNKAWDREEKMVLRDRLIEDVFFSLGCSDVSVKSINGEINRLILEENQMLGEVTIIGG